MKRFALQTILFAILTIFGYSCSGGGEEFIADDISISDSYILSKVIGEEKTITVESTGNWNAKSYAKSWLTVTPSSGGAGETKVTIKINEFSNEAEKEDRTGYILFTMNEVQARLDVDQEWSNFFTLPCKEYSIDHNGGEIVVGGLSKSGFSSNCFWSGLGTPCRQRVGN